MATSRVRTRVLVTGAHGLIGNSLYWSLASMPDRFDVFGSERSRRASNRISRGDFRSVPKDRLRVADIRSFRALLKATRDIDVVVHLAADADGRSGWKSVLDNNIVGTQNVFEASRKRGVRRIVFASSNQVVFGYRSEEPYKSLMELNERAAAGGTSAPESAETAGNAPTPVPDFVPIRHDMPVRPLNYYACSKLFGEALGRMYAETHGMSCLCVRIGWVTYDDVVHNRSLFCSRRDIVSLLVRCIEAPDDLRFDIFFGHSDNRFNLVDMEHAREVLGHVPRDSAEARASGTKE